MMELCPLALRLYTGSGMWDVNRIALRSIGFAWDIDELQNEGPSGDNAAPTWEKISADNVLEDGGLPGGLGAYNNLELG
jgi:hypothetical protein